jgi:hypothetical protein
VLRLANAAGWSKSSIEHGLRLNPIAALALAREYQTIKMSKKMNSKSGPDPRVLVLRAAEAERKVETARKQSREAKARFKQARKTLKQAKKVAKKARKMAKAAAKRMKAKPEKHATAVKALKSVKRRVIRTTVSAVPTPKPAPISGQNPSPSSPS